MVDSTVSIIIPTLNEECFIQKCLNSVFNQTFDLNQMDIMVIDGGSTDRTCDIVLGISTQHPNVRLINNPYKIQSCAFNIGTNSSTAPFIIRLDAHAVYDADYIKYCIEGLQNKIFGNVGGKCNILSQSNKVISRANVVLNHSRFGIGGAAFRVADKASLVDSVPFGAFRREVVEKVGLMNENLPRGEDNEYNARIRAAGYKIYFNPEIISSYFARDTMKDSIKQMYKNGYSIGFLLHTYPKAVSFRHLIPFLFFISIPLLLILSIFMHLFIYLLIIELCMYFIMDIVFAIYESAKSNWKILGVLPLFFFLVHISYGYGTLIGLFSKKYK